MFWQAAGVVVGGVSAYRATRSGAAGVAGAVVGYVALPRLVDYLAPNLAGASATTDTDEGGGVSSGLHVGKAVKRPSVTDAITLLRPTLALYGSASLASAALTNAYAESRFDTLAAGDLDAQGNPQAIGLFQLHSKGAGKGMTVADRTDPIRATERILAEAAARGFDGAAPGIGQSLTEHLLAHDQAQAVDLAALTARFTVEVERPANSGLRAAERVASLRSDSYLRQVLTGLGLPVL